MCVVPGYTERFLVEATGGAEHGRGYTWPRTVWIEERLDTLN